LTVITSRHNPVFQSFLALKTKKGREESGLFLAEGRNCISEIPAEWPVEALLLSESVNRESFPAWRKIILAEPLLAALSATLNPQDTIAVCRKKEYALPELIKSPAFLVLGENLSDPGNIGTLLRTAAAAGAHGFLLTSGSGAVYNPKTVRASAGAVFHLPVVEGLEIGPILNFLKGQGIRTVAAHPRGQAVPYDIDFTSAFCLLIGNEAHGLSDETARRADLLARIPMPGRAESLNASVAGGILIYEAVRQRYYRG